MFNLVYRQEDSGFSFRYFLEFMMGQTLALTPGFFAFAVFALWRMGREWSKSKNTVSLYLLLTSLVPLAYFLYVSLHRRVGIHWPAAAWTGTIVYLAACRRTMGLNVRPWLARLENTAIALCVLITAMLHIAVHIPPRWVSLCQWHYSGSPSRINVKKHCERFGWRELGQWVSNARDEMVIRQVPARKGVFVICSQYGMASSVAFYTPDQIRTHLWAPRRTHGENYRFWNDFLSLRGMDAVFVVKHEKHMKRSISQLREHFRRVGEPECMTITIGGRQVRSFFLVRCYEFNGIEPVFRR